MIRQIRGELAALDIGSAVVNVGGVGYFLHTKATEPAATLGAAVRYHTYLAVRETALDLYGFQNEDDLHLFELLIDLPKVGPKTALQYLSQADSELIKKAAATNDANYLSKLSGISKKSAEKIVGGLKEKFEGWAGTEGAGPGSLPSSLPAYVSDTVDALLALGYNEREAREVTQRIVSEHPETANPNEALKKALNLLNK